MFHGRKKQASTPLTPEEEKQTDAKLAMIVQIKNAILTKKQKCEYDMASLAQTEKFAMIAPDFMTLWNYRRDMLQHILGEADLQTRMELVAKELEFLIKSIKRSPKSYTLWFHRQWIIELGLTYERDMMKALQAKAAADAAKANEATKAQEAGEAKSDVNAEDAKPVEAMPVEAKPEMVKAEWRSKILEMELQLCNKMLQLDERNFHCWNYRLWVV